MDMDDFEHRIVRVDGWLWHLSNVFIGVSVLIATFLYAPPGTHSVDIVLVSIDPFYALIPLSVLYTGWCAVNLWRWYGGENVW